MRASYFSIFVAFALLFSVGCASSSPSVRTIPVDKAPKGARTLSRAPTAPSKPKSAPPSSPTKTTAIATPAEIAPLTYHELLDPNRIIQGTRSIGNPSDGSLAQASTLPFDGAHHKVFEHCRERGTNYGTEELITLIMHAGDKVAESIAESPPLMVCNMSQDGGGDISWSRSHNSGRDADIAFYTLQKDASVEAPKLLSFNGKLKAAGGYTFDVKRNWALAKAMLTHPTIQVQWLFISNPLKEALLKHAVEEEEPEALIQKAEKVLWQPTDSSPHNDHFHLRIYCPKNDRLEGCLNWGPVWDWIDTYDKAMAERIDALLKGLSDIKEQTRVAVIEHLMRIHAPDAAVPLAKMALFDNAPKVRLTALQALVNWNRNEPEILTMLEYALRAPGGGVIEDDPDFEVPLPDGLLGLADENGVPRDPVDAGFDGERTSAVIYKIYATLARLASPKTIPLLIDAMNSERMIGQNKDGSVPEVKLAARATKHIMDLDLVEPLIAALDNEDPETRKAVALTLRRITNHAFKTKWGKDMSSKRRKSRQKKWKKWWAENKRKNRDRLLYQGFKDNFGRKTARKVKKLESWEMVNALVALTKRDDHVGYNADRMLCRLTGRWSPLGGQDARKKYERWAKWWKKNKKRFKKHWG